jgi:lipopolysaccharide transport system permease protein
VQCDDARLFSFTGFRHDPFSGPTVPRQLQDECMISAALLKSIITYRGFIFGSVKREFQAKYRNAILGGAWTILNPLALILVYTVIFAEVMQSRLPGVSSTFAYSIYVCAGILTWGLFAEITARCQNIFLENANLIKKISFPRIALPLIAVLGALLNFAIIFSLFVIFLVITGNFPGWVFLTLFPVLLIQVLFAVGLGIILGVLNVFFRDVGQFFTIFIQFWFWFTPIVYPISILPPQVRAWIMFNPMAVIVHAYQGILVSHTEPDWLSLAPIGIISLLLCVFALRLFRKRSGEMVDEL